MDSRVQIIQLETITDNDIDPAAQIAGRCHSMRGTYPGSSEVFQLAHAPGCLLDSVLHLGDERRRICDIQFPGRKDRSHRHLLVPI